MSTTLVANPERHGPSDLASNVPRAFRVRRPPALEPPFDDERGINDVFANCAPPDVPPAPCERPADERPTVAAPASTVTHAASRYVQVCLEVLNGFRPPSHLRTLAGPVEFADVLRHLRLRRNGVWRGEPRLPGAAPGDPSNSRSAMPNQRPSANGPGRSAARLESHSDRPTMAHPNRSAAPMAFRLLRLRVSEPVPGKAEVVAVIAHAGASLAVAMRLEVRKSSWVCTVFHVV